MFNKEQSDIKPFESRVWLSSPTMHGDELKYIQAVSYTHLDVYKRQILNKADRKGRGYYGRSYKRYYKKYYGKGYGGYYGR